MKEKRGGGRDVLFKQVMDAVCLGTDRLTVANRFLRSLQEPFLKPIVRRGSPSVREQDTAIKALLSYRLSRGEENSISPSADSTRTDRLDDLELLTQSQEADSQKKTTLLFPNCLIRAERGQEHHPYHQDLSPLSVAPGSQR